jgi:hypothetical protein
LSYKSKDVSHIAAQKFVHPVLILMASAKGTPTAVIVPVRVARLVGPLVVPILVVRRMVDPIPVVPILVDRLLLVVVAAGAAYCACACAVTVEGQVSILLMGRIYTTQCNLGTFRRVQKRSSGQRHSKIIFA